MQSRIILDLCSGSGEWSRPYAEAGYRVVPIDLDRGEDIRLFSFPRSPIHGILAAPPCTALARSGARWWQSKGVDSLTDALALADACLRLVALCDPVWWCLENPVGRLRRFYGDPRLIFDPWQYGDPYTKKTLLWGKFSIPEKTPVEPIRSCKQGSWLQTLGGTRPKTKRLRSMTPPGFARAFFTANP
ncbi:MAG: hypothetical protein JWN86_1784 [Planctomycetota bacterium]|nr:hypothetical protein [Planctomycetota bacterium]